MKIAFIILLFNLVIGCNSPDNLINLKDGDNAKAKSHKDTFQTLDSVKKELSDTIFTIRVSYAAIECGCPQWFETKFKDVKFLEGIERFYLEPANKGLINANALWDGEHLPLTLTVTGRFSKQKEIPTMHHTKGKPEKARIFWYDKITVVSPSIR